MILKKYFPMMETIVLFDGIDLVDMEPLLDCISAERKSVKKGGIILLTGDTPKQFGAVLTGQLHVVREDYDGNRSLIAVLTPGEVFAESLCYAGVQESPVTVIADQDSTILLFKFERILQSCTNCCPFHRKLIGNMLGIIAEKNIRLQIKMEILSSRSIRARMLRYIESFTTNKGREITIPLNREELANFLCVERSALSHELMKMKKDGLIDYKKNTFILMGS